MKIQKISKSKISNISKFVISQMNDNRLFYEMWENDVEEYSDFMVDIMTNHSDMTNNLIKSLVLLGDSRKYDNVDVCTFVNKHNAETVEYFNELSFHIDAIECEEYLKELIGYSEIQSDILLETIYHLTIEYELSPFERESIKCFGKNLFSGEKYNTKEFRELS